MQPEIRGYEPREAFVSGPDGLDAIRELIAQARPGTRIALEHGAEQAAALRELLDDAKPIWTSRAGTASPWDAFPDAGRGRHLRALPVRGRRGAVSGRHRLRPGHRSGLA